MDALCTPGGLRAAPEREDLRLFVESIAAVNGTTIAECLTEKMVHVFHHLLTIVHASLSCLGSRSPWTIASMTAIMCSSS